MTGQDPNEFTPLQIEIDKSLHNTIGIWWEISLQMIYLMGISLSYCAQPLQQLLPDQDFWMTASWSYIDFVDT